jgi:hypothetical protein
MRLILYHWPIVSISSLKTGGVTITASADKIAPGYYIDQDIDPERTWNLYLVGYSFTDGQPVAISYAASYVQPGTPGPPTEGQVAPPSDIEQVVLDWCAYRYKERPDVGATARRSTNGESVSTNMIDAPPNVLQVIERYKRALPSLDRRGDERDPLARVSRTESGGSISLG